jgi:hypothetical protein
MAPSDSPRQPIDCYDYDSGTKRTVFWEVFYNFMNRPYDRTYRRAIKEPRERVLLSGPEGPEPALGRLSMNTTTGILGQMRLLWAFGRA